MDNQVATDVLKEVTSRTNSELILFFVIVAVVLIILMVPIYRYTINNAREKRKFQNDQNEMQAKRDAEYIKVIQHNSDVNSQLKTMLELNNLNCIQCKAEHQEKLDIAIEKIDLHNDKLVEVGVLLRNRGIIPLSESEVAVAKE